MNKLLKLSINSLFTILFLLSFGSCNKKQAFSVVKTLDVSSITQTSALASGSVTRDTNGDITSRGICWGTSANPEVSGNKTTEGSGAGTFTSSITGLTPGTKYYARAYAENEAGIFYGSDVHFTTHAVANNTLTIEGTATVDTRTGNWSGVDIQRDAPTNFTFRNNSITSVNREGYMLQAGDESPGSHNNNLDGEVITGNMFNWNGPIDPKIITHGLFAGYNINSTVKYNYLNNVPYGIIFKSGTDKGVNMTFTSGGCSYNIWRNGKFGGRAKGINGVKFYNNTFYSGDGQGWYILLITGNMDRSVPAPSTGTKVFNNIFYTTAQIPMIKIESGCLGGFESDYNIYWCTTGEPVFNIDGATVTWTQWRERGYDAHSRIVNPDFINTTDLVPAARLDYGKDLGAEWRTGLSTTATWTVGSSPETRDQNGAWQVGARLY